MSGDRDQLVELITRQVMAALDRREPTRTVVHAPGPVTALAPGSVVHDPATCERCRNWGLGGSRGPEETRLLANAGAARVVTTMGYCPDSDGLASLIDHTLLKPDATREEVQQLCREAAQFCFASVCVNPNWVALCRELLRDSGVQGVHRDRLPARRAICPT
jgi:hypothetical protein